MLRFFWFLLNRKWVIPEKLSNSISPIADLDEIVKHLWDVDNREIIIADLKNYSIRDRLASVIAYRESNFNDLPESTIAVNNLVQSSEKVKEIVEYYYEMSTYYDLYIYQSLDSLSKNRMIELSRSILSIEDPINLMNEVINLIPFKSSETGTKLPQVR